MDFEQGDMQQQTGTACGQAGEVSATRAGSRTGWRIFWSIILVLSVLSNIALFVMVVGLVAVLGMGQGGEFGEYVIEDGPRTTKIAVINLQGIIDEKQSRNIYEQIKQVTDNDRIKGLIIRVNSPGGRVSSSDQIYHEICRYRSTTGRPVVAFMEGMAASGGYYASVACDRIVAEPTTITGSIGVIVAHLVLQELLEGKLGITPVVVKAGARKDWPSPFEPVTDEQKQYLRERLVGPAYERFVEVVNEGRSELTVEQVRELADGSIYPAKEALDKKLIDKVGYLTDAIEEVKVLAGLGRAQVVELRKQFSWTEFLDARAPGLISLDKAKLYEMATPEAMYLWN